MSASQESQPTLDSIAPRILVGDMEQALAFYGQLGFATTYHDEGFAIVERDGIALHFNVSDVHDLLLFLEDQGFPFAPRFFGRDEQGRDILWLTQDLHTKQGGMLFMSDTSEVEI